MPVSHFLMGAAMRSPVSPVIANLLHGQHNEDREKQQTRDRASLDTAVLREKGRLSRHQRIQYAQTDQYSAFDLQHPQSVKRFIVKCLRARQTSSSPTGKKTSLTPDFVCNCYPLFFSRRKLQRPENDHQC